MDEDALSTVSSKAIVNNAGGRLEPGCLCQVRSGGKVHEATVVASGMKDIFFTSTPVSPALNFFFKTHINVGTKVEMQTLEKEECDESSEEGSENVPSVSSKESKYSVCM